MTFQSLGLSKPLLDALAAKDYSQATPIQRQAIPTVLTGRDLLGIAQTGTGKTAAFMLPSLDRLAAANRMPRPGQVRMLVLAPTRELAAQIAASAQAYGKFMRLSVGVIFGGVPNNKSVRTVASGLDVLVATPGRLLDLIDQRALSLRELEILVLDEADQMLDLGFIHALRRIVSLVPPKRQTLFFSATMPRAIKELADKYLTDPAEPGREGRVARSLSAARVGRASPGVQPHQAWRRQDRTPARGRGNYSFCDPRQQEPGPARAGNRSLSLGRRCSPHRYRHSRTRDRRSGR